MATDIIAIPEEQGLETHGIERVSPKTRTHVRIRDNFTMWLSANLVISTIALGAIANLAFGLGFWDGLAVIIIFNILGVLPVAFFSTLGPKLGLRQMTITRFCFRLGRRHHHGTVQCRCLHWLVYCQRHYWWSIGQFID